MNKNYLILLLTVVLNADIDVIVSEENSIKDATKYELANVYLKKTNEIDGKKVTAVNNKESYNEFNQKVLNKTASQVHAYWMKQIFLGKKIPPKNIEQDEIKAQLISDPDSVVYSSKKLGKKVIYETK